MIKSLILPLIVVLVLSACSDQDQPETKETLQQAVTESAPEDALRPATKDQQTPANGIDEPLEFTLTDLAGEPINASDYRGKWLVINYWATWCAPCRDEMPELVKFQAENAADVQVVGIAFEDATVEKLQNFAKDFNINYPLLTIDVYDPPEFAQEGGLGLPTTIVYTPDGMRHKKHMGPIDAAGLLAMVQ